MTRDLRGATRVLRDGASGLSRNHGMVDSAAVAFDLLPSTVPVLFLAFDEAFLALGFCSPARR